MKRTLLITVSLFAMIAVLVCSTGCVAKKTFDIEKEKTKPVNSNQTTKGTSPSKTNNTLPSEISSTTSGPTETIKSSVDEPKPSGKQVTLKFEDRTAHVNVGAINFDAAGKLMVTIEGAGMGGILPMRDGKIVVPFIADIVVDGKMMGWEKVDMSRDKFVFHYNTNKKPEKVILFSRDHGDLKYAYDVASEQFLP